MAVAEAAVEVVGSTVDCLVSPTDWQQAGLAVTTTLSETAAGDQPHEHCPSIAAVACFRLKQHRSLHISSSSAHLHRCFVTGWLSYRVISLPNCGQSGSLTTYGDTHKRGNWVAALRVDSC